MEFDLFEDSFSVIGKIYEYLENSGQLYDEALVNAIADSTKVAFTRQLMEERGQATSGKFRASQAGPCARKLAYAYHGIPENGKTIDARAKMTFLIGDLLEIAVVALIKLSGIKVRETVLDESGQEKITYTTPDDIVVNGSPDGIIEMQQGLSKEILLEVKSTSQWAFEQKFSKGVISEDYLLQHNIYMKAKNLTEGVLVAVCKNTGNLTEIFTQFDPKILKKADNNYKSVLNSTPRNLPARYHDNDAFGLKVVKGEVTDILAPLCGYCAWYNTCWNNPALEFKGKKPLLRVINMPEDFKTQIKRD